MANPYMYNSYQYSPSSPNSQLNTSPTFAQYSGLSSASSSTSSSSYNYTLHNPRLRYYLSKSFDAEDDLEFCPEIPEYINGSPTLKRFNPYTASVFSPTTVDTEVPVLRDTTTHQPLTFRERKPIEIVNPHTKLRLASPMAK